MVKSSIVVLIPCYNEASTVGKVVDAFKKSLPDADIYVYDNNSSDGTAKIAKEHGAIVRFEPKQGKGNVCRSMFREIEADCYLMVDGDNTYSSKNAKKMCEMVLDGKIDMVLGDRLSGAYKTENKRKFHNFGNNIMKAAVNLIFRGPKIDDVLTGYRAFSRDFVKSFPVLSAGFQIETEMTIHAMEHNLSYRAITCDYKDREPGSDSKLKTIPDGIKAVSLMFSLFRIYRPLMFFGLLSIILAIVSIVLAFPVLNDFATSGLVLRFPTLLVAGFIFLGAMLLLICGLILDATINKNKIDFELFLNSLHIMKDNK